MQHTAAMLCVARLYWALLLVCLAPVLLLLLARHTAGLAVLLQPPQPDLTPDIIVGEIGDMQARLLGEQDGDYGEKNNCEPVKKLIFAKTHKTGSTTVQNIIFRFGVKNNLKFILPKTGSHYFNLRTPFSKSMAIQWSSKKIEFDVFAAHGRWNADEVTSMIPGGTTFTILRDPVATFESFFSYMNIDKKLGVNVEEFAWQFATREGNISEEVKLGRNHMLYDLGLQPDRMGNQTAVRNKIEQLDSQFDQVDVLH